MFIFDVALSISCSYMMFFISLFRFFFIFFFNLLIRAEGRTRTDNIIITNDSQLPIVLHRQNAELLTDMTGTQQGEKVFNLHAYCYDT